MPNDSPRWKRWLSPWNLLTIAVLVWAAPRLLPHVGALIGVDSGGAARPEYSVVSLDGGTLDPASLRGRVVLVNFWATWCAPCRLEMPLLQRMHERHVGEGLSLLGFSVDRGGADGVRTFLREHAVTYPVAIVGEATARAFGGVRGYPTSFLIDRAGVVRNVVIGPLAPATLELAVRRLLDEAPPPDLAPPARD